MACEFYVFEQYIWSNYLYFNAHSRESQTHGTYNSDDLFPFIADFHYLALFGEFVKHVNSLINNEGNGDEVENRKEAMFLAKRIISQIPTQKLDFAVMKWKLISDWWRENIWPMNIIVTNVFWPDLHLQSKDKI